MAEIGHIPRKVILYTYYPIFRPHEPQNFLPGLSGFPQDGHTGAAGAFTEFSAGVPAPHAAPQEPQNLAPGFIGFPHAGQVMPGEVPALGPGGCCFGVGLTGITGPGTGSCFDTTFETWRTTSSWTFCCTCCCTCCSTVATADSTSFWPVAGSISPTITSHSAGGRMTTCEISPSVPAIFPAVLTVDSTYDTVDAMVFATSAAFCTGSAVELPGEASFSPQLRQNFASLEFEIPHFGQIF